MGSKAAVRFSQIRADAGGKQEMKMWKENEVEVRDKENSRETWSAVEMHSKMIMAQGRMPLKVLDGMSDYESGASFTTESSCTGSDAEYDDCGTPKAEEHKILQSLFGPPPPPPSKPRPGKKSSQGGPKGGYFSDPELESFLSPRKSDQT